ncbi:MAG: DUF4258 domain-containing protein [candidate division KSB1 bacterium]|nr:DUF4258 domain-containing protein [candidate division KSB1 bacterium]MDZ7336884.1 DUF4258 domain-containing protein [candidate division KSB1 bacterium]
MAEQSDILILARKAAEIKILYLPHALRQMSRPDRMISVTEIRNVVEHGEVIEDYPEDQRGHSCLIMGYGSDGRPIHVVCSPKEDYLAIITAYIPHIDQWENDFKTRRKL